MKCMALAAALFLCLAVPAPAATTRPLDGTVIMARAGANPLFVWNATPYVAKLRSDAVDGPTALHALEATAADSLASKASALTSATVGMRVVYEKTGAVSELYRTATFEGLEEVLTMTVNRKALLASNGAWASALQNGHTPAGVTIHLTGALPPR
jgi:hypothetical protein